MNDSLVPEFLDIRKAFVGRTAIQGVWPVKSMPRLSGLLSDDSGEASVRLTLMTDTNWRRRIEGEVSATVQVVCERCLDSFPLTLTESVNLALVESEGLAERLPDEIEAWLTDADRLRIPDIVEEQLILGMPIVARHENTECMQASQREALQAATGKPEGTGQDSRTDGQGGDHAADNPFAVLESLKKRDR